jgi:hypothetical protein
MIHPSKLIPAALVGLLAVGLTACGNTVSTAAFKGEQHEVAQALSNLQADVRAADEQKVCANDLAGPVVARLGRFRGGCKQAIKTQLSEIDNLDVTVQSVQVSGAGAKLQASATVKSHYSGKSRTRTLTLVKEGGKWKLSGLA